MCVCVQLCRHLSGIPVAVDKAEAAEEGRMQAVESFRSTFPSAAI